MTEYINHNGEARVAHIAVFNAVDKTPQKALSKALTTASKENYKPDKGLSSIQYLPVLDGYGQTILYECIIIFR